MAKMQRCRVALVFFHRFSWAALTVGVTIVLVGRNLDATVIVCDDVGVPVELRVPLLQCRVGAVTCTYSSMGPIRALYIHSGY